VNYLTLDDGPPHLSARVCNNCDARFFGKRLGCARCGMRSFRTVASVITGRLGAFSIVHRAAAGVRTPFISAIVDLDDGSVVKANLVDCPAEPELVRLGMPVELTIFDAGTDDEGTVAVAFGFRPRQGE
jgi:uncharacterized OB-fold protein